jgi:hypothetical protein
MTRTIAISRYIQFNQETQKLVTNQLEEVEDVDTYYRLTSKSHDTVEAARSYVESTLASKGMTQLFDDTSATLPVVGEA